MWNRCLGRELEGQRPSRAGGRQNQKPGMPRRRTFAGMARRGRIRGEIVACCVVLAGLFVLNSWTAQAAGLAISSSRSTGAPKLSTDFVSDTSDNTSSSSAQNSTGPPGLPPTIHTEAATVPAVESVDLGDVESNAVATVNGTGSSSPIGQSTPAGSAASSADPRFATYDPANGYVYVADYGVGGVGDTVSAVSGASDIVTNITVGSGPFEMTYDARNGDVYVPDSGASTVSVINGTTNAVTTLGVCEAPHSATFDPANGYVYVPCWSGELSVIKGLTNSSVTTKVIGSHPRNAAYDSANSLLYVTNSLAGNVTGYLTAINSSTLSIVTNISVGKYPNATVYDPFHNYVYVGNTNSSSMSIIQASDNQIVAQVSVGLSPQGIAYDPETHRVYVADWGTSSNPGSDVTIVNGTHLERSLDVGAGSRPYAGAYDPGDQLLYFANFAGNDVSVIQPTSTNDTLNRTIPAGTEPFSVAYDSGNGGAYVPNEGSSNLSILPTAAITTVGSPKVGSSPGLPSVDDWNGFVYVPNRVNSTVSVISGATDSIVKSLALPTGSEPWSATFDPVNGRVYVVDSGTDQVSIINNTTLAANVSVGRDPHFAMFDPAGNDIYVFNLAGTNISVISTVNRVSVISGVGSGPVAGAYDPTNGYIYVSLSESTEVRLIDGATGGLLANITVGDNPWYPTYDPSNGDVYVPNSGASNSTSVIQGTSVGATVSTGNGSFFATSNPANGLVYVPANSGTHGIVSVLSGTTIVASATAGYDPVVAAPDPANGFVFVTNFGGSNLTILNGTISVGALNVGSSPRWAVYDASSSTVYVANSNSANVTVIGVGQGGLSFRQGGIWNLGFEKSSGVSPGCQGWDHYAESLGTFRTDYTGVMYAYSDSRSAPLTCYPDGTTRNQVLGVGANIYSPSISGAFTLTYLFAVNVTAYESSYPCSGNEYLWLQFNVTVKYANDNETVYSSPSYEPISANGSNETCDFSTDLGNFTSAWPGYMVRWTSPPIWFTAGVTYLIGAFVSEETHASAPLFDSEEADLNFWNNTGSVDLSSITISGGSWS